MLDQLKEEVSAKKTVKQCKKCTCSKTKCIKLYCECFANGQGCGPECGCVGCSNDGAHEEEVDQARNEIKKRDPHAFEPKTKLSTQG